MDPDLPPQDELRRRIKAAMGFAEIAGFAKLAELTDYSESTLKSLGSSRTIRLRHCREIARACEITVEWFTVPDLPEAVRLGASPTKPSVAARARRARRRLDGTPEESPGTQDAPDAEDEAP